jgi:hypothetical protein
MGAKLRQNAAKFQDWFAGQIASYETATATPAKA